MILPRIWRPLSPLARLTMTNKYSRGRVSAGTSWPQRSVTRLQPGRAKENITSNQLQDEPSCCWGSETRRSQNAAGRQLRSAEGERKGEVVLVRMQKGTTGDEGDQAGVLDVGSGDVWPWSEEVSCAAPSCKKVTPG